MSESPLYTRLNHPHTGDPRVDPNARINPKEQVKNPVVKKRNKLAGKMTGPGFFDEETVQKSSLEGKKTNSSYKIEYKPSPEVPVNYLWVTGEFYTGPLGSEVGEFAGELVGRARIVSLGKKLKVVGYNGIGSVNGKILEVNDPKDRDKLGKSGWFLQKNFSHETNRRRRT